MSSVTDDAASRDDGRSATDIQVTGLGPKVPVLKLKVGAGGYVEGSAVVDDDTDTLNTTLQSNDCSSDFDGASENQSMSTMHSRLSSSSEIEEQPSSEVRRQSPCLVCGCLCSCMVNVITGSRLYINPFNASCSCLLYTSDAADE